MRLHLAAIGASVWKITAGTKRYAKLRGRGRVTVDNYEAGPYTFVLEGALSR